MPQKLWVIYFNLLKKQIKFLQYHRIWNTCLIGYINVTYFFGSDIVRQSMVYVRSIKQLHSLEIHSQNLKDPTHCTDLPMKLTTSTHFEVKMELLSSPSFTAIALIKHSPCFLRTTPFSGLYSYRNRNKNRWTFQSQSTIIWVLSIKV